jgi:hypothetical protein
MMVTVGTAAFLGAQSSTQLRRGMVKGTVFDSIGHGPLAGATVQLVGVNDSLAGRSFTARTGADGRFTIDSVPFGHYVAGFLHQVLDTLGLEDALRAVQLTDAVHEIDFGTPSPKTLLRAICQSTEGDSTSMLIGHVRETESEAPIEGAHVVAEWLETVFAKSGVHTQTATSESDTRAPGWFALCRLPSNVPLLLRASHGTDTTGYMQLELIDGDALHVTFYLGGARWVSPSTRTESTADSGAAARPVLRGAARLVGRVHDIRGRPVPDVHASVWRTGLEARTNEQGVFVLDSLPGGTHTIELKAIGFDPLHRAVQLSAWRSADESFEFTGRAYVLPTVAVRGELLYSRKMAGFERRRRTASAGYFLTSREIELQPPTALTGLLNGISGLQVHYAGQRSSVTMVKPDLKLGMTTCTPSLYLDGMRDWSDSYDLLPSTQIAAVEIYPREAQRPMEFFDRNGCGAIVVWTRPAPLKFRKKARS